MTLRIAVLGANGQLGVDLCGLIQADPRLALVPLTRPLLQADDLPGTLSRLADIEFDVAVNCVAATRVDDCERDANPAVAVNSAFAAMVAEACQRRGGKLVQVSTDYVFGGGVERTPLGEDALTAPLNVYGATKALGESLAAATCENTLVVRVASLFGRAGASGKGGNFVETMLRLARERGHVRVVDDQHMSPTGTMDAARMILGLLAESAPAGVYHAVNDGSASWCEFARAAIETAGLAAVVEPITTSEFPTPARRPPYSVLDPAKISAAVGRRPPHWREALAAYMAGRTPLH